MIFYHSHFVGMGKVLFLQVSVCSHQAGGGIYLGWGGVYLPCMGEEVSTLDGVRGTRLGLEEGVPTLDRRLGTCLG